jgi:hypothetical protein
VNISQHFKKNFICTDAIFHGKYPVPTLLPFFVVHLFQFKKCMFLCLVRETSLFMMLLPFVMLQVRLQCLTQKNVYECSSLHYIQD